MEATLTPYQIAAILQISYDQALYFVKTSGIPYFKIGNQYRVREQVFENFLRKEERHNGYRTHS